MDKRIWLSCFYIIINLVIGVFSNKAFDLNLDNVNHVYHRAAVMALLKSRASTVLKSESISYSDRVFYKQCSKNAQTPAALAKCVVKLLDLNESTSFGSQKDSPSTIERITELIFGKQYLNLPNIVDPQPAQPQDQQQHLQRIVPVNENLEASKFYKATMTPKIAYPFAAKEFYSTDTEVNDGYYQGLKFGLKPYPVKIRPLNNNNNNFGKGYYYPGKNLIKRRLKRQLQKKHLHNTKKFDNLSNLAKIESYYKMLTYCEAFVKKLNDDNSKFIDSASNLPYKFEIKKDKNMTVIENVFEAVGAVTGFANPKSKFSFMSPRLFSIVPGGSNKRKHLLSPTLFSFHEKDGFFPLPDILKKFNVEQGEEKDWLETLLDISGTSETLEKIVKDMEPQMKEMNEKVYPAILEIQNIEENWRLVSQSYTSEQQKDMKENGYAFLEPEQMQLLYSRGSQSKLKTNFNDYAKLSKDERQKRIDEDIRQLAKMNVKEEEEKYNRNKKRRKRQVEVHENGEITTNAAGPHHDYSQEAEDGHGGHEHGPIHFITLEPWAFGSKIGHGAALEAVTLSPHAFFAEVLMPEALILQTLGPRAFIPSILSPNALMGRILSPAAFRAEVLSPRALTAFILTPEALIAEVLSPKFLELRVLSPEALIIEVLSPSIIVPRILSPEAGALLILSPFILSPRILSGHALVVEVLSPHILGGDHDEEEDHEMGNPHDHKPGENVNVHDILGQGEHGEHGDHGQTHQPHSGTADGHQEPIHPVVTEGGHGQAPQTPAPTLIPPTNHDRLEDGSSHPQVEVHNQVEFNNHDEHESLHLYQLN